VEAHQNGLPAPPASASGQVQSGVAGAVPAPDPNAPAELSQAAQQAKQTEQQVITQASSSGGAAVSSTQPVTIALGQTIAQVIANLGPPKRIANLGSKQIYVYNDMKITFVNGKVTDVE
jgi:cytoskeletal protein RodZ